MRCNRPILLWTVGRNAAKSRGARCGPVTETSSRTAVIAALIGNLLIAGTKAVAAALSGSSAMLREAIRSFVDTGNEVLLLYGQHRAAKPPDWTDGLPNGGLTQGSAGSLRNMREGSSRRFPGPLAAFRVIGRKCQLSTRPAISLRNKSC
jgi:hypothetical protein